MPISRPLILVRDVQQVSFREIVAHDLQAHGQAVPEPARDRKRGNPGERGRNRIDVIQVHLHRIGSLGP